MQADQLGLWDKCVLRHTARFLAPPTSARPRSSPLRGSRVDRPVVGPLYRDDRTLTCPRAHAHPAYLPMIRRVPRSRCLSRTRAGQRCCHDAAGTRQGRAVLAAESGLPGNLCTEARRLRTEARRGDRLSRRALPPLVDTAQKPARLTPVGPRRSTRPTAWNRTRSTQHHQAPPTAGAASAGA